MISRRKVASNLEISFFAQNMFSQLYGFGNFQVWVLAVCGGREKEKNELVPYHKHNKHI